MKLLVFSDSHGDTYAMRRALEMHKGLVDYAVFAGDGVSDFMFLREIFPEVTYRAVHGNCDLGAPHSIPEEDTLEVEGARILLVHGHRYGVKFSTARLCAEAQRRAVDLVIYGHTHTPSEEYVDGAHPVTLFNPGSARAGMFGVVEIGRGGILCSHGDVFAD